METVVREREDAPKKQQDDAMEAERLATLPAMKEKQRRAEETERHFKEAMEEMDKRQRGRQEAGAATSEDVLSSNPAPPVEHECKSCECAVM